MLRISLAFLACVLMLANPAYSLGNKKSSGKRFCDANPGACTAAIAYCNKHRGTKKACRQDPNVYCQAPGHQAQCR